MAKAIMTRWNMRCKHIQHERCTHSRRTTYFAQSLNAVLMKKEVCAGEM
jgi:hypothetical protein